jgi:hypothetical protein
MKNNLQHNNIVMFSRSADLAAGTMTGTIFYKQVVKFGKWVNPLFPIEFMELDKKWAQTVVKNFNSKIIDRVPVPLSHDDWDPSKNAGEVVKLEIKEDGLYAYLDIRRPEVVDDINNGLIFDVSISFDWNYTDTAKGDEHGPVLLHVALVNNPYLKGMKPFEQTAEEFSNKFSEALALSDKSSAIMLSEDKAKELKIMHKVKNDKEFDVTITVTNEDGEAVEKTLTPGEEVEVPEDQQEAIAKSIEEAVAPEADDAEGDDDADKKDEDNADDAGEADDKDVAEQLSEANRKLAQYELSEKFDALLEAGKITPAQKEKFMSLSEVKSQTVQLSDKQVSIVEIVTSILEAGPQVLNFSESGSDKDPEGAGEDNAKNPENKGTEELTEAELAGMKAVGADPEKYKEYKEKYPELFSVTTPSNEDK